jgi:hypothetical protein
LPSAGRVASVANGSCPRRIISDRKNDATTPSTAVAHGTISRSLRRVTNSTTLE